MSTSAEIRASLVKTLTTDLVGPQRGDPLEGEQLWESDAPSRWYLTGFLTPTKAPEHLRFDPESTEVIDAQVVDEETVGDDDATPESATARRVFLPSSIGMSVLVPPGTAALDVEVSWGDYRKIPQPDTDPPRKVWQRGQRVERFEARLPSERMNCVEVPASRGAKLYISARPVEDEVAALSGLPKGTRALSVFLVNERDPAIEDRADEANLYQVELCLRLAEGFVARPDHHGIDGDDADERVADLQYRDAFEFAVGHGIATRAVVEGARCAEVRTTWMPTAEVEKVDPARIEGVTDETLSMDALATVETSDVLRARLAPFAAAYAAWISAQRATALSDARRRAVCDDLLDRCELARRRMLAGIEALGDPLVFDAFRLANRAMEQAARQRNAQTKATTPDKVDAPRWRPFQLAFLLLNLPGVVDPTSPDRATLDLLFFPTGGGKTEAYLGIAAFTLVLRRLRDPSPCSAGLSVLMRYTLRLLTLDQLGRAAGLVCALELERKKDPARLGQWPFEVGLWVGRAATPTRMGRRGDPDRNTARARTLAFKNDSKGKPSPIPIEVCPWCGTKFDAVSFSLVPNEDHPNDLRIVCANPRCAFTRDNPLPIVAVDEPLYLRLPCFIIATVDKFASMPWRGPVGKFFGRVERHDKLGFYGPGENPTAQKLPRPLPPPDLIIQDELHLISGPLGTMVGLYETAIERLCAREVDGRTVLPKIIASTATVRRAEAQVRALFGRTAVEVFPPPGPDRRDSFFARTVPTTEKHPRLYVGVAAQGRSLKVVLLRTYLALLSAAQRHYEREGAKGNTTNAADPYMTLLGYFNALRELGGSRRIVEDEVRGRLHGYGRRRRANEADADVAFANRSISFEALELTSRVHTNQVSEAKQRLALPFHADKRVDVALATNMISVGLDITRLGLLVALGQPKTSSEYIQATSRVGRDENLPGLVVTLLNVHKPRDRSHYERFETYHATFYRSVEATSVTPFAPRAVDRGLAAVVVSLARHGDAAMVPAGAASELAQHRGALSWIKSVLRERAAAHRKDLTPAEQQSLGAHLEARVDDLLDSWERIAADAVRTGRFQYGNELVGVPSLLHTPLDADLRREPPNSPLRKFRAQWSMRDVEPEVPLLVKRIDGGAV